MTNGDQTPKVSDSAPHSDRVRDYFDDHAQDWSRTYREIVSANDLVLAERLRLALDLTADLDAGASVLDAGCGAGPLTVRLAQRGHRVRAVDISPQMVELCRQAVAEEKVASSVRFDCGDIVEIGLQPLSFDAIFALGFLQYQDDEIRALEHLYSLLAPGGLLVVSGPIGRRLGNLFGLWNHVSAARRSLSKSDDARHKELEQLLSISPHAYSVGRMRHLLEGARFEVEALRPHGFVNYALIGPVIGSRGEIALHRFFTRAATVLPIRRFANDLVALASRNPNE